MTHVAGSLGDNPHAELVEHLRAFGGGAITVQEWSVPNGWAPNGLSIVAVAPTERRPWWIFATVGCWQATKDCHWRTEFFLAAPANRAEHIEMIKMAAFFHLDPSHSIWPGKVLEIGQPWLTGSACTHLLAALPYPLGSNFEWPDVTPCTRFLWLLPITEKEAALANREDVESLEQLFDAAAIDFADPFRASVVQ